MNKISFIFPVYNEEKRLHNINSFFNWIKSKKVKKFEILIISNGSTDGTIEKLKKLYKKNKYFSLIKIENFLLKNKKYLSLNRKYLNLQKRLYHNRRIQYLKKRVN